MIVRWLCAAPLVFAAFAAAAGQTDTTSIPQRTMVEWRGDRPNAERITYVSSGLAISFTTVNDPDGHTATPVLRLRSADGERINAPGAPGFGESASANFGIGELDPTNDTPEVVFTSYTGGAHCCTLVVILSHTATGWVKAEIGPIDGEPWERFPRDEDGDGVPELVTIDNNFLYAFEGYAGSYAPPVIHQVRYGRLVDASRNARYRRLYEIDYASAKAGCLEHGNGACAAFVADAARLGIKDQAWAIMLRNYDRDSHWTLPAGCAVQRIRDECPKGKAMNFTAYPDALKWFLGYYGY